MARGELHTKKRSKRPRSKKEVKEFKNGFYFTVLSHIKKGFNPQQIANKFKRPKQNIHHYIANLVKCGYIMKVGYGTWETTKLGDFVTSKSFSWGTHERPKKIEIWRMGYRFYIRHDNQIPALRAQTLRNGGEIAQGRILGCWVMKGKEIMDIYGTVSKSDNLWDASMKAVGEIVACKGYIEEEYHIRLELMKALKPDIIINTPETRRIAEKIHKEVGILRTEFMDVDGGSKTGRPELEAKTFGTAYNILENLGMVNHASEIGNKVAQIENLMKGYIPQQLAVSNALNMQSVSIKKISEVLDKISDALRGITGREVKPSPPEPTAPQIKDSRGVNAFLHDDTDMVEVEITNDPGEFCGILNNEIKVYDGLRVGARIYVEWLTARALIANEKARLVRCG